MGLSRTSSYPREVFSFILASFFYTDLPHFLIASLITFMYSISDKREVLDFQKSGPPGVFDWSTNELIP